CKACAALNERKGSLNPHGGHCNWVLRLMVKSTMTTYSPKDNCKTISIGCNRPRLHSEGTSRHVWPIMKCEQHIWFHFRKQTIFQHRFCPGHNLLSWLKNSHKGTAELILVLGQIGANPQSNCRMSVVPTGVHDS